MADSAPAALPRAPICWWSPAPSATATPRTTGPDSGSRSTRPTRPGWTGSATPCSPSGDSSYDDFCGHGRRLDERLAELGAVRLVPRTDCEPDYAEPAGQWLDEVLAALGADAEPGGAARGTTGEAGAAAAGARPPPSAGPRPAPPRPATRPARLVGNRLLSLPAPPRRCGGSPSTRRTARRTAGLRGGRRTRRAAAQLPGTGRGVARGDRSGPHGHRRGRQASGPCRSGDALHRHLDIARITPGLLRLVAERTHDRTLKKLLRPDNKGELAQWTWGRQAVDVIAEYPVRASAAEWAGRPHPPAAAALLHLLQPADRPRPRAPHGLRRPLREPARHRPQGRGLHLPGRRGTEQPGPRVRPARRRTSVRRPIRPPRW